MARADFSNAREFVSAFDTYLHDNGELQQNFRLLHRNVPDTIRARCRARHRESAAMLQNYVPILIFLGVATALGAVLIGLGFLFGPRRPDAEKLSAYECGFEAFSDSRMKFDVRYYLVAILFIVFDLEIAFLFPWAVSLDAIGAVGLVAMGIFLLVLIVGFLYEWKKGALEWD
jgi:NADH-quinone oxidoreductase subunit A